MLLIPQFFLSLVKLFKIMEIFIIISVKGRLRKEGNLGF